MTCLVAYCRAGFEGELAAELSELAGRIGLDGTVRAGADSGYVVFQLHAPEVGGRLTRMLDSRRLVFARQLFLSADRLDDLRPADRVAPMVAALVGFAMPLSGVWVETADTNAGKQLLRLGQQLRPHLERALVQNGRLVPGKTGHVAHVFLLSSTSAHVGISAVDCGPGVPMGILRLKMPARAPSRSTLKLEEAFQVLLSDSERTDLLREGMRAVDLGAAPGGWTYQLVRRGFFVQAVDNAALAASLLQTGQVEHVRADGFHFRPRDPVDWLVCDMVEQPRRIAALVADWLAEGRCSQCLFNLKLPMKKRRAELLTCAERIGGRLNSAGLKCTLRFKHLYHDREEVTGFLRLEDGAA